MESKVDSDNAVFWVEVADDLSSNNVTIYIYYGNSTATTTSNGDNTFLLFDNFDDNSIDTNKWVTGGQGSVQETGGVLKLTSPSTSAPRPYVRSKNEIGANIAVYFKGQLGDAGSSQCIGLIHWDGGMSTANDKLPSNAYSIEYHAWVTNNFGIRKYVNNNNGQTVAYASSSVTRDTNWHDFMIRYAPSQILITKDGTTTVTYNETSPFSTYYIGFTGREVYSEVVQYDLVYVRKFISPEPSHGSWGSEETSGVQVSRTIAEYLAGYDVKSRVASLYRSKMDYIGLFDSKQRVSSLYRVFSEQLGMLESKVKMLSKVFKDYVGMLDKKLKILSKNFTEYLGLLDAKLKTLSKIIKDYIGLLDTKMKTLSKNIIDYLGLYGYRSGVGQVISRIVTEIVGFSDNILKELPYRWRKIRGYFIEDYERLKKKRLLRLLRHYILLESEDE